MYFALQGFNFEDLKVLIWYLQRCAAIMQPKHRLYSGCHTEWFQCLYLSLIAAFKQRPAALLYRCFTVAKFCSAFAVHEM